MKNLFSPQKLGVGLKKILSFKKAFKVNAVGKTIKSKMNSKEAYEHKKVRVKHIQNIQATKMVLSFAVLMAFRGTFELIDCSIAWIILVEEPQSSEPSLADEQQQCQWWRSRSEFLKSI